MGRELRRRHACGRLPAPCCGRWICGPIYSCARRTDPRCGSRDRHCRSDPVRHGYRNLVGIDISDGMLARARERGVYADLRDQVLGETLDFADESFVAVVATGVFTAGHAPASAFIELLRVTRS